MAPKKPPRSSPKAASSHAVKKTWTFKKYRNGLLDLKAPARYMKVTKQNSLESPLLKLPAEIRSKIFNYASGSYDIYIKISNHDPVNTTVTLKNGATRAKKMYLTNHVATTILTSGAEYRPARIDDDLPNLSLSRVCRQMYMEAALLPYKLNQFKFFGHVESNDTGKYSGSYTPFDYWMQKRTPTQRKAIASVAPTFNYIASWKFGYRPAFLTILPGLQMLDLRPGWSDIKNNIETATKKVRSTAKDLAGIGLITWPEETDESRTRRHNKVNQLMAGKAVHFNKAIHIG